MRIALMFEDGDDVGAEGGQKLVLTLIPDTATHVAINKRIMKGMEKLEDGLGIAGSMCSVFVNVDDPEMVKVELRIRR